jgi:hypothetical protein
MVDYKFKKKPRGSHCSKGHEFTEENTFIRSYDNARVCRECRKQYAKEKYQRNKEKNGGVARPRKDKTNLTDYVFYATMSPEAQRAYEVLTVGINNTKTPCMVNGPEWYTDKPQLVSPDEAEQLCYGCPLLKICYDYAVADDQKWGIWGGINFTEHEEELFDDNF